jgi:hypothetical protein
VGIKEGAKGEIKAGEKGEKAKREKGGETPRPFPFDVPGHTKDLFLTRSQVALGNDTEYQAKLG